MKRVLDADSDDESEIEDEVEELDSDTRLGRVSKALRDLESPGSFYTSGSYTVYSLPVITVDGAGPVRLPLTDATAKELIASRSHASPGLSEPVPENTKTWELSATLFKIDNAAWQPFVDRIVEACHVPLGLTGNSVVTAKLYKMALYEAGGKFERHEDAEKEDGVFGKLVVVLPGAFTGGELLVHDPSRPTENTPTATATTQAPPNAEDVKPIVWDAGSLDPFAVKYAAFYGDCPHEVLPVKSGYRLCLTYNLVFDSSDAPLPALSMERNDAVYSSLCEYFADDSTSKDKRQKTGPNTASPSPATIFNVADGVTRRRAKLVYVLSHRYLKSSLSLKFLKSKDALVASNLLAFCRASRGAFELYLCHLKYEWIWRGSNYQNYEEDSDDDDDDESVDTSLLLKQQWTPCSYTGPVVEVEATEDEDVLLDEDQEVVVHFSFKKATAGGGYYIPCTGDGAEETRSYTTAALLLIPTHERLKMQMTQSPIDAVLHGWLPLLDTNRSAARHFIRTFNSVNLGYIGMETQDLSPADALRLFEGAGRRDELPSVGVLLELWSSIPYVAELPAVMATFARDDVVAMMEEVVKSMPAAERSRSVVNLLCSCVSVTTEADKIEQLLKAAQLDKGDWEAVSYARLLAIVVGGAPDQLAGLLRASTKEILATVVSPALRQVLNGSVPDSVRDAVTKLRDELVAGEAGDEVQQEIKELNALLQIQ